MKDTLTGALYRLPESDGGEWFPNGRWEECSSDEAARLAVGCELKSCAVAGPSACDRAATCAALDCDGSDFDAEACVRIACRSDSDCEDDERCLSKSITAATCDYAADDTTCSCVGPVVSLRGATCSPVSAVGPRGEWQNLTLAQGASGCVGAACTGYWIVTPDGVLYAEHGVIVSTTLTDAALAELVGLIDGPELRRGLESGFDCANQRAEEALTMSLTLPDRVLSDDVEGCASAEGHVVERIVRILNLE
jgi:hypothetical protein